MKHVHIRQLPMHPTVVEIEGENVADQLSALQLTMVHNDAPKLLLEGRPGGLEFEGDAKVEIVDPERDKRVIVEFLEGIQAHWLEETMLEGSSMDDGIGSSALRVLIKKAQES